VQSFEPKNNPKQQIDPEAQQMNYSQRLANEKRISNTFFYEPQLPFEQASSLNNP
jgi:hypothetical protein